ncbi:MAG: hypothetical protein JJ900_04385 [Rhodospirillales bacterium]|nr:hypothetical protein [Rhodospirillales bacterium]MBO6786067.1 hypothetical protein [Rhodospirillales bacterium]
MKLRTDDPWMPADEYGRSLRGLGVNLLVPSIDAERPFQVTVLGAEEVYADPDFAVYRGCGAEWILHADHTYSDHPLKGSLGGDLPRGIGAEIRLYGRDPDAAEAAARSLDMTVLAGAMDKPHGLRECFVISPSGYMWVPSMAIGGATE